MDSFDSFDSKQSKFDSTIANLMRLDELWKNCHSHARAGELSKWNTDLDRVFCELSEDVKEPEYNKFFDFNKKISEAKNNSKEIYLLLLKKEIFLRQCQNKQGKGTGYKESEEEYMSD